MIRRVALPVALFVLAASAVWTAVPARADVFGTISLLSANPFDQAEYAHDPVLSENGRYVVFDGAIAGVQGVWRRETQPGASFEQVAGGDATLPSVSADGRYVSFTTNEGASLPAITDGRIQGSAAEREVPSVYVRDMDKQRVPNAGTGEPEFEPGAFTLVSAKDHSSQSLAYEFPGAAGEQLEEDATTLGAVAAGRSAITADGRTVAFVTTAQSDLAGPATPPMQVAVRHLDTDETDLVSVRFDAATGRASLDLAGEPEPVPQEEGRYGAVWTNGQKTPFETVAHGTVTRPYLPPELPGASISADGSTVAWYGGQISEQARTLGGERLAKQYAEPLWRRIGDASEPTRRVSGGSDPESPGCLAHPESQLPPTPQPGDPCQGPFATQRTGIGIWNGGRGQGSDYIPRLSANGQYVAFLASAPLVSEGQSFAISGAEFNSDVYREDMSAPDKTSGLRRLTQFAGGNTNDVATNADVTDLAISADGQQVAFTTRRTVFPLGAPAFVSVPAAVPGLGELFDADLGNETLTRVTGGYEGGAAEHPELETGNEDRYARATDGSLSPSFDGDGGMLSFSSTASNLVFGDGNSPPNGQEGEVDGADVFLAPRIVFSTEPTPQTISPAPANPSLEPPWRLKVSASTLANGTVRLKAYLPGAGLLVAGATGTVTVKHAHRRRRVRRTVAQAKAAIRTNSAPAVLELALGRRYRPLAMRAGGLTSTITVTFAAKGHPTLRTKLAIHFVHRVKHRSGARRRK